MKDRVVMPIWTFGLFLVVMNTTRFNVSIPGIMEDLGISADLASWIISSYSIGYALSTIIYSRLSDLFPIRRLLAVGLLTLGGASILGLFAHTFAMLLLARILQSAGAGSMAGLGLVLASRYVPGERRGRAIALISAGSAMAFGLGPIVGGLISELYGWNGLFGVTCLVLVLLPFLFRLLPAESVKDIPFDTWGAVWTVLHAVTLLTAVTQRSLLWLAVGAVSFAAHARHLKKAKLAFIQSELLGRRDYRKLLVVGFCILILNLGNLFLMPLSLAHLFRQSPMAIGWTIAPGAICSAYLSRFVGRGIDRFGSLRFLVAGHVILAGVLTLFTLELASSWAIVLIGYLFFSPAFSMTIASLNNETSHILPRHWIGSGMGLMQLVQFFGGSVSVAFCGLMLEMQRKTPLDAAYKHVYGLLLMVCLISLAMLLWYRWAKAAAIAAGREDDEHLLPSA